MDTHERFEWDPAKAAANLGKHGVSFAAAARALADPFGGFFHFDSLDHRRDYGEVRWITTATDPYNRETIFVIAWTRRRDQDGAITRIISARRAAPRERKEYEENTYPS